jgi:endonuclease/exonuclease/phosphatase family metal-dependent hydrolase
MPEKMQTPTVSLLSFNTFGTLFFAPDILKRLKTFAYIVNESDIDVICLQEIATHYHFHTLEKLLTKYPYSAHKKTLFGPKGGLAIFSKLPIKDVQYDSFASLGSLTMYTQLLRNGILSVTLQDYPLRICNTHLISDFEYEASKKNRYYKYVYGQVQESAEFMKEQSSTENTTLLAGDFNMTKEDPAYAEFLKISGAVDVYAKETKPTYYRDAIDWKFKAPKDVRIDYIFLLDKYDRITVESTDYAFTDKVTIAPNITSFLSDHIGLLTKFSIRK